MSQTKERMIPLASIINKFDVRVALDQDRVIQNTCDMCKPYDRPGWVINAHQWVKCWQCNPTEKAVR